MRSRSGQHIPDFAGALTVLLTFVTIPLLNISAIPLRYCLIRQAFSTYVNDLALHEKMSDCRNSVAGKNQFRDFVCRLGGGDVKSLKLLLVIQADKGQVRSFARQEKVPNEWLPDCHDKGELSYTLELQSSLE